METLYKLTTYNSSWKVGVEKTANEKGELCSEYFLYAYTSPILAVMLNPIHENIRNPRIFEALGRVTLSDTGLRVGCTSLTLVKEVPVPVVYVDQRIAFGILTSHPLPRKQYPFVNNGKGEAK